MRISTDGLLLRENVHYLVNGPINQAHAALNILNVLMCLLILLANHFVLLHARTTVWPLVRRARSVRQRGNWSFGRLAVSDRSPRHRAGALALTLVEVVHLIRHIIIIKAMADLDLVFPGPLPLFWPGRLLLLLLEALLHSLLGCRE